MGKMHLYKIDEGIDHWIFAPNKREAVKLFRAEGRILRVFRVLEKGLHHGTMLPDALLVRPGGGVSQHLVRVDLGADLL